MQQRDQTLTNQPQGRPGALRRAMSLPASFARRFTRGKEVNKPATVHSMAEDVLGQHLSLTWISGHPDREALAPHLKSAVMDWQAHNWQSLGQQLTRLDQRRIALPSGDRVVTALGQALFRHVIGPKVCQMIDRGQSVTISELPEDLFAPIGRALSKQDTPPAIHFLAAQFNLETGWARRGDDFTEFALEDAIYAAQARFRTARNLLDAIGHRVQHSTYYAEMDYRVRAAEGTTEEELTRALARWTQADPTSLTPYALHGPHLLPCWYGEETSLGVFGDRSWAKTHETLGAAAYAACYLSAMETDPSVLLTYDPDVFRQGLIDMLQQSDDPDLTCNTVLRILWDVSSPGFGTNSRDPLALRRARTDLRALFAYLAKNTLGPVMPDAWGRGWTQSRILRALAEAFEDDITKGRHIAIGLDGAVVKSAA